MVCRCAVVSCSSPPEVVITEMDHSSHGHDHAMGDHDAMAGMAQPSEALMLSVSGSLYWGGMGGTLTIANGGDRPLRIGRSASSPGIRISRVGLGMLPLLSWSQACMR